MAARAESESPSAPERILEAACDLIAADGIDEVRIARVAMRAGASTALVHHYFSTREELLEQALIHSFEQAGDERFQRPAGVEETASQALARTSRRRALCWKNKAWLMTADTFAGWNGLAIRKAGSGRSPVRKRSG